MPYITLFDPWESSLCTCPKKYSLNPYTGCSHRCLYCYITSYIPRGHEARIKKDLIKQVRREREHLDKRIPISMSNSSDPYLPLEKEHRHTRACLELLKDFRVLVITKSDLVTRDIDLLKKMRASVSITITTLDASLAKKLEPNAPSPEKRINALQKLVENGIPVSCRVDPVIPRINEDSSALIKELAAIGVPHVVSSTFKPRFDSWKRVASAFPEEAEKLQALYFQRGERIQNSQYLPEEIRFELMKKLREDCDKHGITFATCREGFKLNTSKSCDGTHLISQ